MTRSPGVPARVGPRPQVRQDAVLGAALASTPPLALVIGVWALRHTRSADIGSLGLVDALTAGSYLAMGLLTLSFVAAVFLAPTPRPVVLAAHILVWTVLLHGAATLVEPLPRFVAAWLHVGFTDYIARTGSTLPLLDARFSWPGFFALAAAATRAAGLPDAMPLLGWTPVVLNVLYAAVVYRLARAVTVDARTAWLATWLFIPANWIGQDYFSPQGLNYFFYLLIVLVLLAWFRPPRLDRLRRRLRHRSARRTTATRWGLRLAGLPPDPMRHEPNPAVARPSTLRGLTVLTVIVFTASTASHQLTPVAILVAMAALVVARRCTVPALLALFLVILLGYVSYLTETYWSGHLEDMIGSVGRLGHNLNANVGARVRGDRGHLIALQVRQLFALVVWGLAAVGAWRLMRRGRGDLALLALAFAPFLLLAGQSYGGEVFLRIYAYALPFMIILMAALLVPLWPVRYTALTAIVTALLSIGLTGAFFVARYGNERFEQVRPADAEAVDWLYAHAAPGSTFMALTSAVPWRAKAVEQYRYDSLSEDDEPINLSTIKDAMSVNPHGAYLILTQGQYAMARSFYGKPPGWGQDIERQVAGSGRFRLVYSRGGAEIYVLARPTGSGP